MTAYPEQAIRQILVDDSDVAALVSTRIYRGDIPQASTLPAIAYILEDAEPMSTLGGHAGLTRSDFTLVCVAATYAGVKDLAEKVRLAVDGYKGTVSISGTSAGDNVVVRYARHRSSQDDEIRAADGSELMRNVVSIDIELTTTTSIPS